MIKEHSVKELLDVGIEVWCAHFIKELNPSEIIDWFNAQNQN